MKMTRCATCNVLLVEGATFCGQCGTVIGNVFEPTMRSSRPSLANIQDDPTINTSAPAAEVRHDTMPAPYAQFRAPLQGNTPTTPPPLQPLSEEDMTAIRRDAEQTYDVSTAYYDEMRGRIAQQPTGPLAHERANEEEKDNNYSPLLGMGLLGSAAQGPSQTVPATSGTPHFGNAPSAQGVPQIAHNMQNTPGQPQLAHQQNMLQQHVQANMRTMPAHAFVPNRPNRPATAMRHTTRINPIMIGSVITAAVVAVMIGVGALIITRASNPPGQKATPTATATHVVQVFHPTMSTSGSMVPGGTITLHGTDFPPGGRVIFKIDGAPLASAVVSVASLTDAVYGPGVPVAQAEVRQVAAKETVVKPDGTFDAQIIIPTTWQGGSQHQIQAEVQGAQGEAHVNLTVQIQKPGVTPTPVKTTCIAISSNQLSFTGVKGKSDPAAQQVKVSNCGDTGAWTAQIGTDEGGNWLSLDSTNGTLAGGTDKTLVVTASNLHAALAAGTYNGHITFTLGSSAETLDVSLSVSSNPCISADTSALNFAGVAGASDPATQTVTITNCGDDEGWSTTVRTNDGNNWLGVDSTNGTLSGGASKTITVTASNLNAQLNAGTYNGTITFTAGQKSATVNVTLIVSQAPCIKVDQTTLAFSGVEGSKDPAAQQVTLTNCGANGNWTSAVAYDDASSGWLSSDTGGTLNSSATQTIKITASNLTAQLAAGTYRGHVTYTITTSTGTKTATVNVTLTVYAKPCITPGPTTFTFSGVANTSDPAAQTETLKDCGDDGSWTATVSSGAASWLSLGTTSGSLSAGGTQTLNVTASNLTGKLSAGTYTGTLTYTITTVHGATTSSIATVTLTVYNPPCFQFTQINGQTASSATTDSISFSAVAGQSNPSNQTVTLNNCSADSGDWKDNVTSGNSWLSTGSSTGTLSANTSQDVTISAANQSAGSYTGQIVFTLTTPGGTASITLNVTFTVQQGPCIQVTSPSSGSLSFSGTARTSATNTQTVTILNCGTDGTWSVTAATSDGASWLGASTSESTSGTLTAGSSLDLASWADSSSLTAGTYTGTLTFTMQASNGTGSSTAKVSVTFTVQQAACMNVSAINGKAPSGSTPYTLTFYGTSGTRSPDAQAVTLSNCGGDGTVSASITYGSNASGWLSTGLTNGTSLSAGGSLDVSVNATTGSLTIGQYTATIRFTITTSAGTYYQDVNVVFNISASLS